MRVREPELGRSRLHWHPYRETSPEQVSFITPDSESDVGRVSPSYNASEGGLKLMAHSEEASVTVPWTSYYF